MVIVALSGWKGSGKDTIARYMVDAYGFKRLSFADPLKDLVSKEYGIPREHFDDINYKERPILNLPVVPNGTFSKTIHSLLMNEFKKENNTYLTKKYHDIHSAIESEGQLYWTPRALAIFKGSGNRSVSSSYWVKLAIEQARNSGSNLFVISDLRFVSEVNQVYEYNGKKDVTFVRVNRFINAPSNDESERNLDNYKFDYYIDNSGTKESSFLTVDFIMENILCEK